MTPIRSFPVLDRITSIRDLQLTSTGPKKRHEAPDTTDHTAGISITPSIEGSGVFTTPAEITVGDLGVDKETTIQSLNLPSNGHTNIHEYRSSP